jgi:DedD protein
VESPLKERLTGALIVVAVLVIAVPEMLSGPDKASAHAGSGGEAGPPERTFSLELGSNPAVRSEDQSSLTPQSATPPAAEPVKASPPPTPESAVESPAATPTVVNNPPPPAADVKPAVEPVALAKGQWWTQLGSFSARENAERLARALRDKGYSINVARLKVAGKDLYRVRAGPVANREAAAGLQARLAAAGHKSTLVPP